MKLKDKAAALLLEKRDYLSGEEACAELGVTRASFQNYVKQLRAEGWDIDACTNRGYRVLGLPDALIPALMGGGRDIILLDAVDSTNRYAKTIAAQAENGACVITDCQTAGRGRRGRSWEQSSGVDVFMSLILKPDMPPEKAVRLTIIAALAVRAAIKDVAGLDCGIKWPNDIQLGGKKLCGIMLELSAELDALHYVIAGIGINVNRREFPEELKTTAGSLALETGNTIDRNALVKAVLERFDECMALCSSGFENVMREYKKHSCTLGREVVVRGAVGELYGIAEDFDSDGMLLLRTGDGLRKVASGDVSLRLADGSR